jgi:hypothetical protein
LRGDNLLPSLLLALPGCWETSAGDGGEESGGSLSRHFWFYLGVVELVKALKVFELIGLVGLIDWLKEAVGWWQRKIYWGDLEGVYIFDGLKAVKLLKGLDHLHLMEKILPPRNGLGRVNAIDAFDL